MRGAFQSGADRERNFDQPTALFIERAGCMAAFSQFCKGLPDFRIHLLELLHWLWQCWHFPSLSALRNQHSARGRDDQGGEDRPPVVSLDYVTYVTSGQDADHR